MPIKRKLKIKKTPVIKSKTPSVKVLRVSTAYIGFYSFLFLIAVFGFSFQFKKYVFTQARVAEVLFSHSGSVAGTTIKREILTIEIRGNDQKAVYDIKTALTKNPSFKVTSTTVTPNTYSSLVFVDNSLGEKVKLISDLENFIEVGSQIKYPSNEEPTRADVLLLLSSKN